MFKHDNEQATLREWIIDLKAKHRRIEYRIERGKPVTKAERDSLPSLAEQIERYEQQAYGNLRGRPLHVGYNLRGLR